MPIPTPNDGESSSDFMQRCLSDDTMVSEYPDEKQRLAVCIQQSKKEVDKLSTVFKSLPMEVKTNENKNLVFKISTNLPDRDEDILEPQGVNLENYRANPCVLFAHDYSSLPVGKSLWEKVHSDSIESEVEFAPTAFAQDCKKLCEGGFLNAASVGFIGHKHEPIEGSKFGKRYTEWELLEWSVVPVPSNFGSLLQNAKAKGINLDAIEKELMELEKVLELKEVELLVDTNTKEVFIQENGEKIAKVKVFPEYYEQIAMLPDEFQEKAGATLSSKTKKMLDEIHENINNYNDRLRKFIDNSGVMPEEDEEPLKTDDISEVKQALDELKNQVSILVDGIKVNKDFVSIKKDSKVVKFKDPSETEKDAANNKSKIKLDENLLTQLIESFEKKLDEKINSIQGGL